MIELRSLSGSRDMVRVSRDRPCRPRLHGYILGCSDTLALMHAFDDFEPDGYSILRLEDVADVRCGEHEHHWHRMLTGEGLLAGLELAFRPDLSSMSEAIASIWHQFKHLIIHCEDADDPIEDFYVGHPLAVGSGGIIFRHLDANGHWHSTPDTIGVAEITLVEFDTPYINHFTKYLDSSDPGEVRPDEPRSVHQPQPVQ